MDGSGWGWGKGRAWTLMLGGPAGAQLVGLAPSQTREGTLQVKGEQAGLCCSLKLGRLGCDRRAPWLPRAE